MILLFLTFFLAGAELFNLQNHKLYDSAGNEYTELQDIFTQPFVILSQK